MLDLNGDGVKDRVVLLSISKKSKFVSDIVVSNPFPKQFFHKDDANLTDTPHLAIGIIHNATETAACKRFVIYNNAIFGEWIGPNEGFPIELYQSYKLYAAISIWTREGNDNVLFWNGKEYEAEYYDYEPQ